MTARSTPLLLLVAAVIGVIVLGRPAAARAAHTQTAIIEDNRLFGDPDPFLARFRALGVQTVRVIVNWASTTPDWSSAKAPKFDGANPDDYPAANWAPYDTAVRRATAYGLKIEFTVTGGAPRWAEGPGLPRTGLNPNFAWKPDPTRFRRFVQAVGKRYDGSFTPRGQSSPLPAVRFWTIWNEPNFGEDLGPQAIDGSAVPDGPRMYRNLVAAGWAALHATGHSHDRIVIGSFAAQGISHRPSRAYPQGLPGNYGQMKPLPFIRALYCLDGGYRPLRGRAAAALGCPTTAAGSARFRAANPGLFNASGVADHPYSGANSPAGVPHTDPSFATFAQLVGLERALDTVNRAYRSGRHYPIYSDEYGYITRPPAARPYVSPSTAAYYLNWAEYLSWRNPRVASYAQYLLDDPAPERAGRAGFASGLLTASDQPKLTFAAFRLPLYLPQTHVRRGRALEVWGDARPAASLRLTAGRPTVAIQLQAHSRGPFKTVRTVRITSPEGYIDVRQTFASTGKARLAYSYPGVQTLLPDDVAGGTVYSRVIQVVVS
jgi:hypothetical protein